ncbi:MAG TPA: N-formylglutamate amidohydrolase [Caulobacteraceae bacterium]|jgi:N-formylglutamate amidohydrolase|nr:N-formylglutamate amidohydrolase [Caulobacteraceae bacterium]
MNAPQPLVWTKDPLEAALPAFTLTRPACKALPTPLIFASPHSGRIYPVGLMAASALDEQALRRSEDAWVDALVEAAPGLGIPVLAANYARAWLDVNREPWELDQAMFDGELPPWANGRTARVAAGLGSIARVVCEGLEIYRRKLTVQEALERVEAVHHPYHLALAGLVAEARQTHGVAILVDWHSMPAAAAAQAVGGCDLVLGDRFGAAASPAVSRRVEQALRALGYSVARNAPYAGGYTTEHYGRPARGVHALQIELSRGLYMDEATLSPTPGFTRLKAELEGLFAALAGVDWSEA